MCTKDKIKTLEIELDEERSSLELLNDRISRSRDQVSCDHAVTIIRRKRLEAAANMAADMAADMASERPSERHFLHPLRHRWTSFAQN